jgi:hypothetical protein
LRRDGLVVDRWIHDLGAGLGNKLGIRLDRDLGVGLDIRFRGRARTVVPGDLGPANALFRLPGFLVFGRVPGKLSR